MTLDFWTVFVTQKLLKHPNLMKNFGICYACILIHMVIENLEISVHFIAVIFRPGENMEINEIL